MATKKTGRPRKAERKDTRRDLLEAAILRFSRQGFQKVALSDIAEDAGVSIGLIRHYFDSKDGLIEQCNGIVSEQLRDVFRQILSGRQPADGESSIDQLQRRTIAAASENIHLFFYLKHLAIEQSPVGAALFSDYFQMIQDELNRLEAQGYLRKNVNKVWLTFHVMFMQMGPVFLADQIKLLVGTPAHSERAVKERGDENVRVLKYGILDRGDQA